MTVYLLCGYVEQACHALGWLVGWHDMPGTCASIVPVLATPSRHDVVILVLCRGETTISNTHKDDILTQDSRLADCRGWLSSQSR